MSGSILFPLSLGEDGWSKMLHLWVKGKEGGEGNTENDADRTSGKYSFQTPCGKAGPIYHYELKHNLQVIILTGIYRQFENFTQSF